MTLIEEYYELNEAEEVPAVWKIMQICFYGASAGFGLWSGFTMGVVRIKLGDRCYLYTDFEGSFKNDTQPTADIEWESDAWCDYYQFSLVSSFIVGIIWAAFFLMCGKGGKSVTGLPQPWRIVWPSLIFNLCYFLAILGISISIQEGTNYFCQSETTNNKNGAESCRTLRLLITEDDLERTQFQIRIIPKTAWVCAVCWLVLFLLSLFRIVFIIDFRMYKICVFKIDDTIQNKKEEVLKVTNYEEPKAATFDLEDEPTHSLSQKSTFSRKQKATLSERRKKPDGEVNLDGKFKESSPLQSNTAFYLMSDKMLSKRKKVKNPSKALEEAFSRSSRADQKRPFGAQSNLVGAEDRPFFREHSRQFREDEGAGSPSATQKPDFNEDLDKSESASDIALTKPNKKVL